MQAGYGDTGYCEAPPAPNCRHLDAGRVLGAAQVSTTTGRSFPAELGRHRGTAMLGMPLCCVTAGRHRALLGPAELTRLRAPGRGEQRAAGARAAPPSPSIDSRSDWPRGKSRETMMLVLEISAVAFGVFWYVTERKLRACRTS